MASYKLNAEAELDIKRIYRYGFEKFGEPRADEYLDDLYEHLEKLADNPNLYQAINHVRKNYQRRVFRADHVYYRIQDEIVGIMVILGRQDLERWL